MTNYFEISLRDTTTAISVIKDRFASYFLDDKMGIEYSNVIRLDSGISVEPEDLADIFEELNIEYWYKKTCENCDGEGSIDQFKECGRVASMCCGGCSEEIECPDCCGEGKINEDL
jgi:predicted methyltransferase